tara:strand:- start:554 stop:730 length:177 start_codon:yes stop_codon:yes gene_type:complete
MPSLDGYSLNQKMDRLHEDVQSQIDQLKIDFHNLYEEIKKIKPQKVSKKPIKKEAVDA